MKFNFANSFFYANWSQIDAVDFDEILIKNAKK